MPFSLGSYLLGVGTVVGALSAGIGGGVVLTHTVMQESAPRPTRVEQVARVEPAPQTPIAPVSNPHPVATDQVPPVEQEHPAASTAIKQDAGPAEQPAVSTDPVPPVQEQADTGHTPDPQMPALHADRGREPIKHATTEPQSSKQADQDAKPASREPERRAEHVKRYAEKPHQQGASRTKERRPLLREDPEEDVVVERPLEQQHFELLGGFFGRPAGMDD